MLACVRERFRLCQTFKCDSVHTSNLSNFKNVANSESLEFEIMNIKCFSKVYGERLNRAVGELALVMHALSVSSRAAASPANQLVVSY